jgi:GMP synthase-like glutamine amidotransferase
VKPVAIFRHAPSEGPGYFATALEERSIPSTLIALDAGEPAPRDVRRYSGLVFMGGPMSVNDELAWIAPVLELIREAVRKDVPVLGHCLGGQLIAKAFGGAVRPSPVKEIGWGEVRVEENGVARAWLGDLEGFEAFHWHGETFSIPPGATRVLSGAYCANQAFALGKHFGMQCHVEMTPELVRGWCALGRAEIEAAAASPAVQSVAAIELDLDRRVEALNKVAARIYEHWLARLAKGG